MPATFQDTAGRVWSVSIGTDTIKRVRSSLALDFLETYFDGTLRAKLFDVCLLVDTLYVVCKEQADAKGITDVDFGRSMSGEVLETAAMALEEALFFICPPARREIGRTGWQKMEQVQTKACQMAVVRMNDPEIDRMIDRELTKRIQSIGSLEPKSGS